MSLGSTPNNERQRILVVSQTYAPQREGGAERVARLVANHLAKQHDVLVLSLDEEEPLSAQAGVVRLAYQSTTKPGIGGFAHVTAFEKALWHGHNAIGGVKRADVQKVLDSFRPSLIYAHNALAFQPQLGRLAAANTIPTVLHMHDYGYLCPRTTMFNGQTNCAKPCNTCRLFTKAWRNAAHGSIGDVIAVSAFVRERMIGAGFLPQARWHIVHNVDTNTAPKPPAKFTEHKQKFTFAYLGAIAPYKGVDILLKAFADLDPSKARLIIAGSGHEAQIRRLKTNTQGQSVEWVGQVDANDIYRQTDTVIVPSLWHEPQALVVSEALARGLPIIGSRRGGTTERLETSPNCTLFEPDDPSALLQAMRTHMQAPEPIGPSQTDTDSHAYLARIEAIVLNAVHANRTKP